MKKVIAMLLMLCMVLGMSVVASAAEVTVNDATELATAISTAVITVIVLFLTDRKLLREIDFMLLLTFVCFFTVSENL